MNATSRHLPNRTVPLGARIALRLNVRARVAWVVLGLLTFMVLSLVHERLPWITHALRGGLARTDAIVSDVRYSEGRIEVEYRFVPVGANSDVGGWSYMPPARRNPARGDRIAIRYVRDHVYLSEAMGGSRIRKPISALWLEIVLATLAALCWVIGESLHASRLIWLLRHGTRTDAEITSVSEMAMPGDKLAGLGFADSEGVLHTATAVIRRLTSTLLPAPDSVERHRSGQRRRGARRVQAAQATESTSTHYKTVPILYDPRHPSRIFVIPRFPYAHGDIRFDLDTDTVIGPTPKRTLPLLLFPAIVVMVNAGVLATLLRR